MDDEPVKYETETSESLAEALRSVDDEDYAVLERQYQYFLEARQQAFQQTRYIYENLDKWLLSLSGAGVAFATGSVVFGTGKPSPIAVWAAASFATAIIVALLSKALAYNKSKEFSLQTDSIWQEFPRAFDVEHRRMSESMLPQHDTLTSKLNSICFFAFILGIVLIVLSALARSSAVTIHGSSLNVSRMASTPEPSAAAARSTEPQNPNYT